MFSRVGSLRVSASPARITIAIDRDSIRTESWHEISPVHPSLPSTKRLENESSCLILLLLLFMSSRSSRCKSKGACKYACYRIFVHLLKTKNKGNARVRGSVFFFPFFLFFHDARYQHPRRIWRRIRQEYRFSHTACPHCAREALPGSVIKFRSLVTCCLKREHSAPSREYVRGRGEYHRSRLTDGSYMADVSACYTAWTTVVHTSSRRNISGRESLNV